MRIRAKVEIQADSPKKSPSRNVLTDWFTESVEGKREGDKLTIYHTLPSSAVSFSCVRQRREAKMITLLVFWEWMWRHSRFNIEVFLLTLASWTEFTANHWLIKLLLSSVDGSNAKFGNQSKEKRRVALIAGKWELSSVLSLRSSLRREVSGANGQETLG